MISEVLLKNFQVYIPYLIRKFREFLFRKI